MTMTPAPSLAPNIQPPPVPLRRRPIFTPYVFGWIMAGTLAAGYFAILVTAPDLLEDLTPGGVHITEPQDSRGQRAAARLASDVRALRDSMAQVQFELSKVKTDVATQSERERVLTAQLVALEKKLSAAEAQKAIETAVPRSQSQPPAGARVQGDAAAAQQPMKRSLKRSLNRPVNLPVNMWHPRRLRAAPRQPKKR